MKIDICGNRYGRLVAIRRTEEKAGNGTYKWECKCDCGRVKVVALDCLRGGRVKSCGCLGEENKKRAFEKGAKEIVDNTKLSNLTSKIRTDNTSGRKGVCWLPKKQRWFAYITLQKKMHHLGWFKDYGDAVKARETAEAEYFKPMLEKHGRAITSEIQTSQSL